MLRFFCIKTERLLHKNWTYSLPSSKKTSCLRRELCGLCDLKAWEQYRPGIPGVLPSLPLCVPAAFPHLPRSWRKLLVLFGLDKASWLSDSSFINTNEGSSDEKEEAVPEKVMLAKHFLLKEVSKMFYDIKSIKDKI